MLKNSLTLNSWPALRVVETFQQNSVFLCRKNVCEQEKNESYEYV